VSYAGQEASQSSGQPVELYRFALGANKWLFTSGQTEAVYQSETYEPTAIRRSGIEQGNEINRAGLEITLPRDNLLANQFIAAPPDGVMSVTLYRYHVTDTANEVIVLWKGRVGGARLSGSELVLKCEPIATSLKRPGLRARYQLLCRHPLYSAGCGVAKESFMTSGTVVSISGATVQVAAAAGKPDGYFVAGMLATNEGQRMIIGHSGANLTLVAPMPSLEVGDSVRLYAGCDHSTATCLNRFNNLANFGGFPYIPQKNPFSGDAIV
jgi:uncharacterized phage protein (TIGR02218 family)